MHNIVTTIVLPYFFLQFTSLSNSTHSTLEVALHHAPQYLHEHNVIIMHCHDSIISVECIQQALSTFLSSSTLMVPSNSILSASSLPVNRESRRGATAII